MDRSDIYTNSSNSNWTKETVQKTLEQEVYNDANAWKKFLQYFLITLAIGFSTAGIIFFFAFNWDGLHRFVKLGLIEFILILIVVVSLYIKNELIKNILITAASVLVGALFAVFGQIYQTSATLFDFFLGWTSFVAIWVLVNNFSYLWAFFLYLLNMTVGLYFETNVFGNSIFSLQVALIILNSSWLLLFQIAATKFEYFKIPNWLKNLVFIVNICIATIGLMACILEKQKLDTIPLVVLTSIIYILGSIHAFRKRALVFLATIPFSLIVIISCLISKILLLEWTYLVDSVFVTVSVGYLINYLIKVQKKWKDG